MFIFIIGFWCYSGFKKAKRSKHRYQGYWHTIFPVFKNPSKIFPQLSVFMHGVRGGEWWWKHNNPEDWGCFYINFVTDKHDRVFFVHRFYKHHIQQTVICYNCLITKSFYNLSVYISSHYCDCCKSNNNIMDIFMMCIFNIYEGICMFFYPY